MAWHRDRTATDAADAESPAHGPQARVWNGILTHMASLRQRATGMQNCALPGGGNAWPRPPGTQHSAWKVAILVGSGRRQTQRRQGHTRRRLPTALARREISLSCADARKRAFLLTGTTVTDCRMGRPCHRRSRSYRPAASALSRLCAANRPRRRARPSSSTSLPGLRNARIGQGGERVLVTRGVGLELARGQT